MTGVNKIANVVEVTLGPRGRNVAIERSYGPTITKDGVTVAKYIEFQDKYENLGAQLVRHVTSKTNDVAGDGTTTTTVLARAILREGYRAIASGLNAMDVKRGVDRAVIRVLQHLKSIAKPVQNKDEIFKVACISSNADHKVAQLIVDAFEKVGKYGVISIQDGTSFEDSLEITEGLKFDRGYMSPLFITDTKKQTVEYEKPLLLFVDHKISGSSSLIPLMEQCHKSRQPLIIIAKDIDEEALSTLLLNRNKIKLNVCVVKAPGVWSDDIDTLHDIAILTGGVVVSEDEMGPKLEEITLNDLGRCGKITVTKESTTILNGMGKRGEIDQRIGQIRLQIAKSIKSHEKDKLNERLNKLSGGATIIRVGGMNEVEMNNRKDRLNDALNATKAAMEEGVVVGGGLALLYSTLLLNSVKYDNDDQRIGIDIIRRAIQMPAITIINNSGKEGAVYARKMLDNGKADSRYGYDCVTDQWCDLYELGVIDPVKVVCAALRDSASVASLMTMTEAVIIDLYTKKETPFFHRGGPLPNLLEKKKKKKKNHTINKYCFVINF